MPATANKLKVALRWIIKRDMPEVYGIEDAQFPWPWTAEDFRSVLRQRKYIGQVAEIHTPGEKRHGAIAGFMIYELTKTHYGLVNIAVHAACERHGVGRALVEKLIGKLRLPGRNKVIAEVRETNVDAQLFFKAMGFRAVGVIASPYEENDEDAIAFEYRLGE